jgi:hypothetical protein
MFIREKQLTKGVRDAARRLWMNSKNNDQGSEDTTKGQQAMDDVAEGHRALEEQHRRVEATAPATTDQPIQGLGDRATGSEDNSKNIDDMERVKENTRAQREQAERVDATTPPEINKVGPPSNSQ